MVHEYCAVVSWLHRQPLWAVLAVCLAPAVVAWVVMLGRLKAPEPPHWPDYQRTWVMDLATGTLQRAPLADETAPRALVLACGPKGCEAMRDGLQATDRQARGLRIPFLYRTRGMGYEVALPENSEIWHPWNTIEGEALIMQGAMPCQDGKRPQVCAPLQLDP